MNESIPLLKQNIFSERKSIRKYKKNVTISDEALRELLQLTSFAPSSWNLQHWKFIVVNDQTRKERIFPIAYNQQQVIDCSTLIIVLGDLEANKNAERILKEQVEKGYLPHLAMDSQIKAIDKAYHNKDQFPQEEAIRNASLAAMQFMLVAKSRGFDTGPMVAFDSLKLIQELNIPNRYIPVLMITLGHADGEPYQTIRLQLDEFVIHESF